MRLTFPRLFLLLLGCLLLLNLIQAGSTELLFDEAYYWYYARQPAWGYFDHPPMVAWMIWLGNLFSEGELGVRLISCLMGVGTFMLIWRMVDLPDKRHFVPEITVWLFSIVLLHAYGFLSLPDTPLLFFTTLFLLLYRDFLQKPSPWLALVLGLSMAALMYSKYHGVLVILFVLLSNLKLLGNRLAWLALVVSLIAYTPHLWWLYEQDFVSVKYHLYERPNQAYSFTKFTLGFFVNLIALFGLTFPWVYKTLYAFRPSDKFQKALRYLAFGIILFFFLSSFQRRVQTQWLIVACVPIAVIMARCLVTSEGPLRKWILRTGLLNIAILLLMRVGLAYEPLSPIHYETHGNQKWVQAVDSVAGDARVVFENSYRLASMYGFYSGTPSFSINNVYYRKNQYSIDASEARMQGKKVFFVYRYGKETPHSYTDARGRTKNGVFIDSLVSYRKLEAGVRSEGDLQPGSKGTFWVRNTYNRPVEVDRLQFAVAYLDPFKEVQQISGLKPVFPNFENHRLAPGDTLFFGMRLPESRKEAPRFLRAVVREKQLPWGLNGSAQKIVP